MHNFVIFCSFMFSRSRLISFLLASPKKCTRSDPSMARCVKQLQAAIRAGNFRAKSSLALGLQRRSRMSNPVTIPVSTSPEWWQMLSIVKFQRQIQGHPEPWWLSTHQSNVNRAGAQVLYAAINLVLNLTNINHLWQSQTSVSVPSVDMVSSQHRNLGISRVPQPRQHMWLGYHHGFEGGPKQGDPKQA